VATECVQWPVRLYPDSLGRSCVPNSIAESKEIRKKRGEKGMAWQRRCERGEREAMRKEAIKLAYASLSHGTVLLRLNAAVSRKPSQCLERALISDPIQTSCCSTRHREIS